MTPRILVTGSRAWTDAETVRDALDDQLAELGEFVLVHGACPRGADMLADQWAREHDTVTVERWPARWDEVGKKAGIIRNFAMVESGVNLCLGFQVGSSPGTAHCVTYARAYGVDTRVFRPRAAGVVS